MEYLVTGRQAKAIDTYTIEHTGIPSLVLMERASLTIAEETAQVAAQLKLPAVRIAAVCGSGNNGGDGIAAARILHSRGCHDFLRRPKRKDVTGLSETVVYCREFVSPDQQ